MRERPLPFSAPMIRAVLRTVDSKTQTRRTRGLDYFSQNDPDNWRCVRIEDGNAYFVYKNSPVERVVKCPFGKPGDRLWVREAFALSVIDPDGGSPQDDPENYDVIYKADDEQSGGWSDGDGNDIPPPWKPSIHMWRWASRIDLEVVSVRVERLHDISEEDAKAEGCWTPEAVDQVADRGVDPWAIHPSMVYRDLWEEINGAGSWELNPFLWVVEFRRLKP